MRRIEEEEDAVFDQRNSQSSIKDRFRFN
jgi:cell division protein FtsB